MSRSGYSDDYDGWASIRWRGTVKSAIRGQRGQAFLRELAAALDAMPVKRLVADELQAEGAFCALGVVGAARGLSLDKIDTEDWGQLSREFGISKALAREIMAENDEPGWNDNIWVDYEVCGPMRGQPHKRSAMVADPREAEKRWGRVRQWAAIQIKNEGATA